MLATVIAVALPPPGIVELYIEFVNVATALAIGILVYALAWITRDQ